MTSVGTLGILSNILRGRAILAERAKFNLFVHQKTSSQRRTFVAGKRNLYLTMIAS